MQRLLIPESWQMQFSLINDVLKYHDMEMINLVNPFNAKASSTRLKYTKSHTNNSLYYGWQPLTPIKLDCSWRKCFKDFHHCKCRDDEESWGQPPNTSSSMSSIVPEIPDVTMLHRMYKEGKDASGNIWPPLLSRELCEPIGYRGQRKMDNNKELFDTVPIRGLQNSDVNTTVFCMIYTLSINHPTRVRAIRETWAGLCDGFLAFSNQTDLRIPAISIPHEGIESYDNMWQKVRSIWNYVGTHYMEDFDYFLLGGDDLFVIPTNLRRYLSTLGGNPDNHHFLGRRYKGNGTDNYFNTGGPGYVLSRGTLRMFVREVYSKCHVSTVTYTEDVILAECLRTLVNIRVTDTRDTEGRERFHPFSPGAHLTWELSKEGSKNKHWYEILTQEWGIQLGTKCCAPDSVSFHYIKSPAIIRHLFSLLYLCNNKHSRMQDKT
jgi:glycoprotein-N-acetylgalactosamine 3-beta-galactosyltransferase